jgi:poly-gamma-glutamate synthesis protein (capsule biosynthesis protein)
MDFSNRALERVADQVHTVREPGDRVVVSIHWGANWGYEIPAAQTQLAHGLIDAGVADIVHGHSSHHVKRIEVYGGRLVLYGCGDFITDYEGISGYEAYRPDFAVAYLSALMTNQDIWRDWRWSPFAAAACA